MDEPIRKRVDESWKEQAEREKQVAPQPTTPPAAGQHPSAEGPQGSEAAGEMPQARFDLFVSGLAVEALIALGDMANPATRKQSANLPQARYLIDLLGILADKTRGNLSVDEEKLLTDTLYQLRMRYLAKATP